MDMGIDIDKESSHVCFFTHKDVASFCLDRCGYR